jgi:AbrB family looped-hinge helix DNA binding protein
MEKFPMPKMYGAVTVGERGQIVIPAQARRLFRIKPGDKLVVFAKANGPIGLVPAENFSQFLDQATTMLAKLKAKTN